MIRALFFVLALGVTSSGWAQNVPATNTVPSALHALTAVGNVRTVQPVLTDLGNFTKLSYETGALGDVVTRSKSLVPVAGSNPMVIDVVGRVPKASVAAAFGRFAVKSMPLLSTGAALYDLAKDLGYDTAQDAEGVPRFTERIERCVAPTICYEYKNPGGYNYPAPGTWSSSAQAACSTLIGKQLIASHLGTVNGCSIVSGSGTATAVARYSVYVSTYWGTEYVNIGLSSRIAQGSVEIRDVDVSEVTARLSAKNDWVEANPLARMLVDAIKSGESVESEVSTVTGPASTPAVTTTTNNTIGNTTTTTTNQNQYSYAGDKITTNNVTTSTTINNTTGDVIDNSTTTTTPSDVDTPSEETAPLEDPCIANPSRIGCSEFGTAPGAEVVPDTTHAVTVSPIAFASLSACPSPLNFSVMMTSYSVSYQPLCDQLALLRVLFLAMAALVAGYIFTNSFKV